MLLVPGLIFKVSMYRCVWKRHFMLLPIRAEHHTDIPVVVAQLDERLANRTKKGYFSLEQLRQRRVRGSYTRVNEDAKFGN